MKKQLLATAFGAAAAFGFILVLVLALGSRAAPERAEAVGAVMEGPANVAPMGTSLMYKITSKALFAGDRVVIEIGKGDQNQKISFVRFRCQSTGELVGGVIKRHEKDVNITPGLQHHEVWSANFSTKCITGPGSGVTAEIGMQPPQDVYNKPVIKEAHIENKLGPKEQGEINFVSVPSVPPVQEFKVTSKNPIARFDRVEIAVGSPTANQKVQQANFICQSTGQIVAGELKRIETDLPPLSPWLQYEWWSGTFTNPPGDKCITPVSGVTVQLVPVDPFNVLHIKAGLVRNTTCCSANVQDLGHTSFGFKVTSKALFPANRVVVAVGKPDQNLKVQSAAFTCQSTGETIISTTPKGHEKNVNTPPNVDHELWSATFSTKCIEPGPSGQGVTVIITAVDPFNQIEVKEAFVQNIDPFKPTATPTRTPTPTDTPPPVTPTNTPKPTNGSCVKQTQSVTFQGLVWDRWNCAPLAITLQFSRVSIYVGAATQAGMLDPDYPPRFLCASNKEKVVGRYKGLKKDAQPGTLPHHEVWSAEFIRKCGLGFAVYLRPDVLADDPVIKGVLFTNISLTPTPTKQVGFDSDGDGCTDDRENGPNAGLGGRRNYRNRWDFYDVNHDGTVNVLDDIIAVAGAFGLQAGNPNYSPEKDRSPSPAPGKPNIPANNEPWDLGPPDGNINIFTDILGVAGQFGHTCGPHAHPPYP